MGHDAISNYRSQSLNFEVFPICDFCFVQLSKCLILDEITFSWSDMICASTAQEPFNFLTCLIAGKVDRFTASYQQFV